MWIGRKFAGKEVKLDITQFVFILVVEVVWVFEYFRGMLRSETRHYTVCIHPCG
jgi:hypothetical protein